MLKKWLHKVLPGKQPKQAPVAKEILSFDQHHISADMLSFAAEKVVRRLHDEGFQAYVVGGTVRDLLLGVEPKDLNQVSARARLRWTGNTSGGLYHRFAEAPSQFEIFCAELYRELGYQVEVTPPIANNGFDLDMFRSGERTLIECKCFKPDNPVCRPVLQKLFGAKCTLSIN